MRDDDEGSFEAFVADRSAALLRTAVLLTHDRGHAEDLVQAALIKTYRHWRRVRERGDPAVEVAFDAAVRGRSAELGFR